VKLILNRPDYVADVSDDEPISPQTMEQYSNSEILDSALIWLLSAAFTGEGPTIGTMASQLVETARM
jgi:hypothetical protein